MLLMSGIELCLQLDQELVHHVGDGFRVQGVELDDAIEAVARAGESCAKVPGFPPRQAIMGAIAACERQ